MDHDQLLSKMQNLSFCISTVQEKLKQLQSDYSEEELAKMSESNFIIH